MFRGNIWIIISLLLRGFWGVGHCSLLCAPADGFFVPVFNDAGAKVWDVRGSHVETLPAGGVIRLQDLYMRLFDRSGRVRMVVGATEALLDLPRREISGDELIHAAGELFTALGTSWKIYDPDGRVAMNRDVRVFFEMGIDAATDVERSRGSNCCYTLITGASLQILSNSDGTLFNFDGPVEVLSGDFTLTCDSLHVRSLPEEFLVTPSRPVDRAKIQKVEANGNVSVFSKYRSFRANSCEIYPEENVVIFFGDVCIGDGKNTVTGEKFILRNGSCQAITNTSDVEFLTPLPHNP
jgi:lipopolysaccharide export system protein LptA